MDLEVGKVENGKEAGFAENRRGDSSLVGAGGGSWRADSEESGWGRPGQVGTKHMGSGGSGEGQGPGWEVCGEARPRFCPRHLSPLFFTIQVVGSTGQRVLFFHLTFPSPLPLQLLSVMWQGMSRVLKGEQ